MVYANVVMYYRMHRTCTLYNSRGEWGSFEVRWVRWPIANILQIDQSCRLAGSRGTEMLVGSMPEVGIEGMLKDDAECIVDIPRTMIAPPRRLAVSRQKHRLLHRFITVLMMTDDTIGVHDSQPAIKQWTWWWVRLKMQTPTSTFPWSPTLPLEAWAIE